MGQIKLVCTSIFDATAGVKLYVNGGINFTGSLHKSRTAYDLTAFITSTTANNTYQTSKLVRYRQTNRQKH